MRSSFSTAISLASIMGLAQAHGFFTTPSVEFRTPGEDPTAYTGTIDGPSVLPAPPGMTYSHGPSESVKAFTAAFGNSSSFKSLRDFVMKHQTLEASKGISKQCEGFTPSHEGPCEVWCDDVRVFQDANCAKSHQEIPAKLPYDKAKCRGKKLMQFVWLTLHEVKWQVYTNCVPLLEGAFKDESASRDSVIAEGDAGSEHHGSSSPDGSAEDSSDSDGEAGVEKKETGIMDKFHDVASTFGDKFNELFGHIFGTV
ncbi:hypothetical protein ATCC90586_008476 [Pythium insidiosum]|nr:hypothetical protein ATCC90586_008476 [Pythium insidiosum]